MDYNEIINKYETTCKKLDTLKENKVVEFNATVKADLQDLLAKDIITRDEVEGYLVSLKRALSDKEREMNMQIEKEKNNAKEEVLANIRAMLNSKNSESNISLTDAVMEESLDYIEKLLASKEIRPEQKDPITERLNRAMPANTYTRNNQQQSSYTQNRVEDVVRQPERVVEPPRREQPVVEAAEVKTSIYTEQPSVKEPQPIIEEPKAKEPVNEEPKVSTVELEKMLAEFDNLV